jgi:dihydroorotase-like cyclic amidohydrolase
MTPEDAIVATADRIAVLLEAGADPRTPLPGAEWTVGEDGYESRSVNSWCAGRRPTGRVLMTLAAGRIAFRLRSFSLGVAS